MSRREEVTESERTGLKKTEYGNLALHLHLKNVDSKKATNKKCVQKINK